jgi:hypothetical protein
MPPIAPAARTRIVIEAIAGLQRLQKEMASSKKVYEDHRRALEVTIRELRKSLSAR